MKNCEGAEQLSLFAPDILSGKMCPEPSPAGAKRGRISRPFLKRPAESQTGPYLFLDLRPGAGNLLGPYWEYDPPWLGPPGTLNTSESPNGGAGSSLSQILQDTVPSKYYLSKAACLGILRRAEQRGKALPPQLKEALELQAGVSSPSTSTSGRRP